MSGEPLDLSRQRIGISTGDLELQGLEAVCDTSAHLVSQAHHSLLLFSRNLDPRIYDRPPFIDALHRLALHNDRNRIQILLLDNQKLVKYSHRLLELARRLTSRIELRRPISQYAERGEEYLLVDRSAYLHRDNADDYQGIANYHAPLEAKRLQQQFLEAWEHSQPDPDLRRLYL